LELEEKMIRIIHGHERAQFPREIDEMHRLRRKVFYERMGWDVPLINAWEVDGFDVLDPVYLLCMNDEDHVVGSVRLLPTIGFNMLNDVFPQLLPPGETVYSPLIWEMSRFSVDHEADLARGGGLGRGTLELSLAANEIGMQIGLSHFVTVYDSLMHRMLKRAGCAGEQLGPTVRIGRVMALAVMYEVGAELDSTLRRIGGIEGPIIEPRSKTDQTIGLAA
jgi:N-acyl-L-homoserine lactone synthetase